MRKFLYILFHSKNDRYILIYFSLWVILTTLSFSMFDLPFIWISFVPLVYILHQISIKNIVKYGFIFSYIYYISTLYWLIAFHEISAIFVFPIYALYLTFSMILIRYLSERFPYLRIFIFPLIWISFEILRSIGFFGFRWNTPVDALWKQIILVQSSDIIGGWGVSFLILLINSLIAELLLYYKNHGSFKDISLHNKLFSYIILFLFLGNIAYGLSSFYAWKDLIHRKLFKENIALIQPNRPGHSSWSQEGDILSKKYLDMIYSIADQNPDLILQTEIMLSTNIWKNINTLGINHPENYYEKKFIELAKDINTPIMLTHFANDNEGNLYNSATLVTYKNGKNYFTPYHKIHIVPFGEWLPGSELIPWLNNLLSNLGAAWASPGKNLTIFTSKNRIKFALLICFEDIYAILGRLFVQKGAQYFTNATNDGWAYRWKLGAKTPLWQHLANSTHTAVSLRRSIARSVNTGISAVVDPMGHITVAPIKEYTSGICIIEVPVMPSSFETQYVKWGWKIPYFIFSITILLLFYGIFSDYKSLILKRIL